MSDNQGSFVSGLTVGLFAGAASYFLFGTDRGKKLRVQLEREWQAAQAANPEQGQRTQMSLNARGIFDTIKQVVSEMAEQQQAPSSLVVAAKKAKKVVVKKSDPRFKGV